MEFCKLKHVTCITFLAIFIVTSKPSNAEELTLQIFVENYDYSPSVKHEADGVNILQGDNRPWELGIAFEDKLKITLLIDLEPAPEGQYAFSKLEFEALASQVDKIFIVKLAPMKSGYGNSATEIKSLSDTKIEEINEENLPVFFQKVRVASINRMKNLNGEWHKLSDYHVQAVSNYLKTVFHLMTRSYFTPNYSEVIEARNWLQLAISNKPDRVGKAFGDKISPYGEGLNKAANLIKNVNRVEGIRFDELWDYAEAPKECTERYRRLMLYKEEFFAMPNSKAERISSNIGIYRGNILSGLAECTSTLVRCLNGGPDNLGIKHVQNLIKGLKRERETTDKEVLLYKKLSSDIASLENLEYALKNDLRMYCDQV